jgi:hypothetical protein
MSKRVPQRGRGAHDGARLQRRQLALQVAVLGHQRVTLGGLLHGLHDLHALERLLHEVVGAATHGLHSGLDGAVGGHQHHLGVSRHGVERLQELQPAHARHHQVGHHHGHALLPAHVQRRAPAGGREHARPLALEDAPQALEVGGVVIDDEEGQVGQAHGWLGSIWHNTMTIRHSATGCQEGSSGKQAKFGGHETRVARHHHALQVSCREAW